MSLFVPRPIGVNLDFRRWLLNKVKKSKNRREAVLEGCRRDISFWINAFVYSYNPDPEPVKKQGKDGEWYATGSTEFETGPFITYDFQDRALQKIDDAIRFRHTLVIEKSRDMGASWLLLLKKTHMWLFETRKKMMAISRDAESVDGGPDSLFWKIDFVLERLPEWMRPEKYTRTSMFFENESNGSTIHGTSASGKATIGGRSTWILFDEFTQIREARKMLEMSQDNSKARIFNFTHDGIGTEAHKLTERPDVKKLVMHWSEHPEKNRGLYRSGATIKDVEVIDRTYEYPPGFQFVLGGEPGGKFPGIRSPWYDRECEDRTARDRAMNLDIDPAGSSSQWFDAVDLRLYRNVYCRPPVWRGELSFDVTTAEPDPHRALMERADGRLRLWIPPKFDGTLPADEYYVGCDPSEGVGVTPSCLTIANSAGLKIGSWVSAHVEPRELAPFMVALALFLKDVRGNGAKLIWETPGPGSRLGRYIIDLGYRNIYYSERMGIGLTDKQTETPGYSSQIGKKFLMESYRDALSKRLFTNRCGDSIDDCFAWVYSANQQPEHPAEKNKSDPVAGGVNHGDRVIADALAWVLVRKAGRVRVMTTEEVQEEVQVGSLKWRMMLHEQDEKRRQKAVWI